MLTLNDVKLIDNGAKFLNADLHVHSYGASADVKDQTMTVQAIIDSAVRQKISLLAITDHNSDANVEAALEHAQQYAGQILLLPGTEITTAHGHLLVYFAPEESSKLQTLLAKIDLVGKKGAQDTHTARSMADVIQEAERLGGICIAAHIDRQKTGFEMIVEGYPNWKKDILACSGLYAVEIDDVAHLNWYSEDDDRNLLGSERKKLLELRSKTKGIEGRTRLAQIQGSDAHSLSAFNHSSPTKLWTRFKLNALSFEAFRTALVDSEARVRAKASIPLSIPRIHGIHFSGGFLNGETIHFSDNLNCFIGGRGTGKSTVIRTLGYCLGSNEEFSEFGNCADTVTVWCEDANGVLYRYERNRGGDIVVKAKEEGEITDVPIDAFRVEYYGQGKLADVAKDPLNNPSLFQEFLDRHINIREYVEQERTLTDRLKESAGQLLPIETVFKSLPAKKQELADINKKLIIAEEGKLQEIVGIQTKVASEKSLKDSIVQTVASYKAGLSLANWERDFDALCETAGDMTDDQKSKIVIESICNTLNDVNAILNKTQISINDTLKKFAIDLEGHSSVLKENHSRLEGELSSKISELRNKGLAGNLAELQQFLKHRGTVSGQINTIEQKRRQLDTLRAERQELIEKLTDARNSMTLMRKNQLKSINEFLNKIIKDYTVFVRYSDTGITDEFFAYLSNAMHGSYLQDSNIRQFCQNISPQQLAKLIRKRDVGGIEKEGKVHQEWATIILQRLNYWNRIFELEVLAKPPAPVIIVRTRTIPAREIPVIQLSDGQRHTILLTIAMLAESNIPLIIDQPEDDLDNAFIFTSIVKTLRNIKEQRQVIVVTHNANIAVLGDSELLCPMQRIDDLGGIVARGSIDRMETKDAVQAILEGGEIAFRRRREIYGH